ncbi:MAG TPA: hypothetical protein VIG30_13550 [Ktedonobacterales bacterium]
MVTVALLVKLEAKPGKEAEVESFLRGGLAIVREEPATTAWFALRMGPLDLWHLRCIPRRRWPPGPSRGPCRGGADGTGA